MRTLENEIGHQRPRVETDHILRIVHEIRERIDVIIIYLPILVADQIFDATDFDVGCSHNFLDGIDNLLRWRNFLNQGVPAVYTTCDLLIAARITARTEIE